MIGVPLGREHDGSGSRASVGRAPWMARTRSKRPGLAERELRRVADRVRILDHVDRDAAMLRQEGSEVALPPTRGRQLIRGRTRGERLHRGVPNRDAIRRRRDRRPATSALGAAPPHLDGHVTTSGSQRGSPHDEASALHEPEPLRARTQ
jgi:hypothetical protein